MNTHRNGRANFFECAFACSFARSVFESCAIGSCANDADQAAAAAAGYKNHAAHNGPSNTTLELRHNRTGCALHCTNKYTQVRFGEPQSKMRVQRVDLDIAMRAEMLRCEKRFASCATQMRTVQTRLSYVCL